MILFLIYKGKSGQWKQKGFVEEKKKYFGGIDVSLLYTEEQQTINFEKAFKRKDYYINGHKVLGTTIKSTKIFK